VQGITSSLIGVVVQQPSMPARPDAAEPRVLSSCHPQRTGSNNLRNSPLFAGVFLACRPSQPGSGHVVGSKHSALGSSDNRMITGSRLEQEFKGDGQRWADTPAGDSTWRADKVRGSQPVWSPSFRCLRRGGIFPCVNTFGEPIAYRVPV
jgi:hypothetical protein